MVGAQTAPSCSACTQRGCDWLFSPHQVLAIITSVSVTAVRRVYIIFVLTTPDRGATIIMSVSVNVVQRVYIILFSQHQTEVLIIIMPVSVTAVRTVYNIASRSEDI